MPFLPHPKCQTGEEKGCTLDLLVFSLCLHQHNSETPGVEMPGPPCHSLGNLRDKRSICSVLPSQQPAQGLGLLTVRALETSFSPPFGSSPILYMQAHTWLPGVPALVPIFPGLPIHPCKVL